MVPASVAPPPTEKWERVRDGHESRWANAFLSAGVSAKAGAFGRQWGNHPMAYRRGWNYSSPMLYTLVVLLVVLWLLGFIGHIGGGLIHLLLVIAVIVLIVNFISGRR